MEGRDSLKLKQDKKTTTENGRSDRARDMLKLEKNTHTHTHTKVEERNKRYRKETKRPTFCYL
jgi:hypothetical protein